MLQGFCNMLALQIGYIIQVSYFASHILTFENKYAPQSVMYVIFFNITIYMIYVTNIVWYFF